MVGPLQCAPLQRPRQARPRKDPPVRTHTSIVDGVPVRWEEVAPAFHSSSSTGSRPRRRSGAMCCPGSRAHAALPSRWSATAPRFRTDAGATSRSRSRPSISSPGAAPSAWPRCDSRSHSETPTIAASPAYSVAFHQRP